MSQHIVSKSGNGAQHLLRVMRLTALALVAAALATAEVSNMSGTWILNEKRSRFGDNPRPANVTLNIEHSEPKLRYSGTVNHPNEGHILDFQFDGSIDGKSYTSKQERGDRQITFKRRSDRSVESSSKWSDGELTSVITMSGDGRTLERRMSFRDREGRKREWTEVYEKKQ
ncbi:MAG TPA: hypothetical protein VES20_06500 [Bryobacteraceae bacterium]|nr:hypothetical protein [Bryobacteraceae bacterium]